MLSYHMSLRSEFRVVKPSTISEKKRWSVRLCLQLFVGGLLSYLSYLHLIVNSRVQRILTIWETWLIRGSNCLPFAGAWVQPRFLVKSMLLIVLVFCVVLFRLLVCLRPVSFVPNVASFSGLSIHDCPFGFL
jgi:hypothetical protein